MIIVILIDFLLKVQGMSFIAAVLILNLEEADAFIAFANLLNKPCQLAFFRVDHSMVGTFGNGLGFLLYVGLVSVSS